MQIKDLILINAKVTTLDRDGRTVGAAFGGGR